MFFPLSREFLSHIRNVLVLQTKAYSLYPFLQSIGVSNLNMQFVRFKLCLQVRVAAEDDVIFQVCARLFGKVSLISTCGLSDDCLSIGQIQKHPDLLLPIKRFGVVDIIDLIHEVASGVISCSQFGYSVLVDEVSALLKVDLTGFERSNHFSQLVK